jgi:hypothetical protein
MHRRLRWGNVARAAGAALIVALVVAWPRLAPPEPALPVSEAAPLEEPTPRARARERSRGTARRRKPARRAATKRARRDARRAAPTSGLGGDEGGGSADPAGGAGGDEAGVDEAGGVGPPVATAVPVDPAQAEFGFEVP